MSSDVPGERQVSDELLRQASEVKAVRHLPDALFGAPVDEPKAEPAASDSGERPVLVVIADSLSYFGPKGGLPADHPRIWPNLVAAELDWDVELVARIGWTCRDAYWALIGDPRIWAAVPRAGAVVFATGGMDSLPSPLPTALRELIRYVRPPFARRYVRNTYNWLQPRLSHLGFPVALPPAVSVDYLEQSRNSLVQLRPELPVIGVLPSVHQCDAYGRVHKGREPMVRAVTKWAADKSVPLVDLGEAVRDNVFNGPANPDGIHWGWDAHTAVARAMVKVLTEATTRDIRTATPEVHTA
ncbi:diglucosylglycerate octanoyltransferase [Nocardia sp. NPDC051030]|uniref:diglucosylglycerate octanoyltransferase n=1 Tax=Nocardia sp. NPDC051030 TaxID=3155162 RepID=UPI003442D773